MWTRALPLLHLRPEIQHLLGLPSKHSLLGKEYVSFRPNQVRKLLETIETRVEVGLQLGQVASKRSEMCPADTALVAPA